MLVSELVAKLEALKAAHGDHRVMFDQVDGGGEMWLLEGRQNGERVEITHHPFSERVFDPGPDQQLTLASDEVFLIRHCGRDEHFVFMNRDGTIFGSGPTPKLHPSPTPIILEGQATP